ncbi:MAG TPA: filamentous hemagglutinin N-terminal domain-containing protein, partial [Burkholderiaceae bacterium]|nr:filamentous hemagglutinin N-terminal domain-containing protein [Burkholderiaceae bacterium]
MNRSYRLIWNESTQTYAVAPERTRAGGRRSMGLTLAAAGLVSLSPILGQAADLPRGGTVVQGSGSIAQAGNTLTISQSSQNLQLNWQQFNIGAGKQVQFVQPGTAAVAVNRVLGNDPSNIYGSLKANGQVFLINPNGVLFGKSSSVDVGGLVASTLDLKNTATPTEAKLTGNGGTVVNQGSLRAADGGYIALLGQQVTNDGTITARLGTVALGAGNAATLQFAGNRLINVQVDSGQLRTLAANHGLIQADGGTVLMTAATADKVLDAVINNDGVIEARTFNQHGGVIKLLGGSGGGTVQVNGRLDASAPGGGDGGQIETSGAHVKVADGASITTVAAHGRGGTWLLDPTDFTIAPVGGDITGAQLSALVQSNSTTKLSADGASGSNGDINVNDVVSWSTSNTLTLSATHNVNVNSIISASGTTAGLVMTPGVGGTFNLGSGGRIDLTGAHPSLTIAGQAYTVINNSGGPGTAAQALQNITSNLSGNYALGSNVDLASIAQFQPIGFNAQMLTAAPFSGVFDGLGHTIQNLTISGPPPGAGLFWSSTNSLRNVGLLNANVVGTSTTMPGFGAGPVGLLAA